jgi:hypothetical protein
VCLGKEIRAGEDADSEEFQDGSDGDDTEQKFVHALINSE